MRLQNDVVTVASYFVCYHVIHLQTAERRWGQSTDRWNRGGKEW